MATPEYSLVVPVFNEETCIAQMVARAGAVMAAVEANYELIFVNDGSRDGTLAEIQRAASEDDRIHYISFSRNFGHQMALSAGLEHARGNAVISLDGDMQHPPELIPELIRHWKQGHEVVYTVRVSNRGHRAKEFVSRAFYWLLRKLTGVEVPTGGADFRLLDRKVVNAFNDCEERFVFVRGLIPWLGFRRKAVPYEAEERFGGETKYVASRMLSFALDGIFSFSTVPLRLITLLGIFTMSLGAIYGIYTAVVWLFSRTVSGWASLVFIVLIFSGTQLLSLGILSEYVGRIYEEVKHRPRYVVAGISPALRREESAPGSS